MTDQVNPKIKKFEDLFKDLAWDTMVDGVLAKAGINIWPLNFFIKYFTDKLYEALRLQFDVTAIVFISTVHRVQFDKAAVALKIIAHNHGPESQEFKKAREYAKMELARFVRYGATT